MDQEQKREVATFRFGVIHDFVNGSRLSRRQKRQLLRDKCARRWLIPHSNKTRISQSTIRRWIRIYRHSGSKLESLYPKERSDQGASRSIDEETGLSLLQLRAQLPAATVPVLVKEMKKRHPGSCLPLTTAYRFLKNHGSAIGRRATPEDRRKFEAELPNDIWQSDVMHGPRVVVNDKKRKSYLIAFIDDHSRLICHGRFYLSENLASFMNAFEKALLKRGLPRKLYVDNGPAFRSKKLEFTTASLGIALIHSRPYKPQGKGKIERFFRTVRADFLTGLNANTLAELNRSFDRWLDDIYHQRRHSATAMSPFKRFTDKMECVRPAPENLKDHFRKSVRRTVAADRTVTIDGNLFEAPIPLIGKRVLVLYHEDRPLQVEVVLNKQSHGFLVPVDLGVNCHAKRDRNRNTQLQSCVQTSYRGGSLWSSKGEANNE